MALPSVLLRDDRVAIIEIAGHSIRGSQTVFRMLQVNLGDELIGWATRDKHCVINFVRRVSESEIERVKKVIESTGEQRVVRYSIPPQCVEDNLAAQRKSDVKDRGDGEARLRAKGFYIPQ